MITTDFQVIEFSKFYGDDVPFRNRLTDINGEPVVGALVDIWANGVRYSRTTDDDGWVQLNINWLPVSRTIECVYNGSNKYKPCKQEVKITIKKIVTRMEGTDVVKTVNEKAHYQCAVYDHNGRVAGEVKITVNGVTYTKTPDATGLYKLNINLPVGEYTVKAVYSGSGTHEPSSIINTVKVKPTNCNSPYTQTPLILKQGSGALGQKTPYSCGPHCLMQAFYHLTGVDMSEETIMKWAGTTTAGTGHAGLNTAVSQFNKKYGENIRIEWRNLSDFGNNTVEQLRNIGKLKCEGKFVFFHLLYRNQYGHYETYKANHGIDQRFDIANSLGNRQGNGYYGYIENRSYNTQKSYIKGISQPSVAILSKG